MCSIKQFCSNGFFLVVVFLFQEVRKILAMARRFLFVVVVFLKVVVHVLLRDDDDTIVGMRWTILHSIVTVVDTHEFR